MAMKLPTKANGLSSLLKDGYKSMQGLEDAVYRNIDACRQLAMVTRTSFGPNGMNKMVINHLEKLFVTNDAATVVRELEVVHPAARLLVLAGQQQEGEVGDATNFVIVFAGELLSKADHLLRMGVHTADVIDGYEYAVKEVLALLSGITVSELKEVRNPLLLKNAIRSAIASKQYGQHEFLGQLIVDACLEIMPSGTGSVKGFNVDGVRVVKILGAGLGDSRVVRGMVFHRECEGDIKNVTKAKIAIYSCALDVQQTETKGTVLLNNATDLMNFSKGEEKQLESAIKEIADSGVNVIVSGSGIGDLALHFCNRYGILVVKILSKFDLRRLCKVVGASALTRLGVPLKEEMGYCDVVESVEIGSDRCTSFRQESEKTKTVTIVLRGGTQNYLDDIERAVDDGVNVVKALCKEGRLVAGAGASEIELARQLMSVAAKTGGMHSHAIKAFAEAFEVIPRTLAENAGYDATEALSRLYAAHANGLVNVGVNIEDEVALVGDVVQGESPIYDSYAGKFWAIKGAAEAALTVLRVDQIIMSKPAGGPKAPKGGNQYEEDD